MRTKVTLGTVQGFSENDAAKLRVAAAVLEYTINLQAFKERILSYGFQDGGILTPNFRMNSTKYFQNGRPMTRQEIYDFIMCGFEISTPEKDNEFDIAVQLYETNNDVLGYTYAASAWQHVNNKYFQTMTWAGIASNMCHEFLHRQGFEHESNYTKLREFTVPYAVGYIVKDLASKL